MNQTLPDWLQRYGHPLDPSTLGTGIFLFSVQSGRVPRKEFHSMTYPECIEYAESNSAQEFKWVPEHIADLQTLSSMPCGQRCNDFSGCDGGCLCDEQTRICE